YRTEPVPTLLGSVAAQRPDSTSVRRSRSSRALGYLGGGSGAGRGKGRPCGSLYPVRGEATLLRGWMEIVGAERPELGISTRRHHGHSRRVARSGGCREMETRTRMG